MARPYTEVDFSIVEGPDFREDSVREVFIVPLLTSLGFGESAPYRIIRSRPLIHPYVYIGTVKKRITIIPDYLLQRDGGNAWILDAKLVATVGAVPTVGPSSDCGYQTLLVIT